MKKLLLAAGALVLVRWLNKCEADLLDSSAAKRTRPVPPRPPIRAEVVRNGSGW